jgi:hypothetical protein
MEALLHRHAAPLMIIPIANITTTSIAKALAPINASYPLTARKVLNAVSKVLKFAKVRELRATADEADWRGTFEHVWAPAKAGPHHRALAYVEVPSLMERLRGQLPCYRAGPAHADPVCVSHRRSPGHAVG